MRRSVIDDMIAMLVTGVYDKNLWRNGYNYGKTVIDYII